MVIFGFICLFFLAIYYMFLASYTIFKWIPVLLGLLAVVALISFILNHWILTLVTYTICATFFFVYFSDEKQDKRTKVKDKKMLQEIDDFDK